MELINDKSTITENTPKIFETPNHFIINTQIYDKQTLKPFPMKFCIPVHNNYNTSNLYTSVYDVTYDQGRILYSNCQRIGNYKNIIKDKYNDNIFYITGNWNSHDSHYIARIIEKDNEFITDKLLPANSFGNTEYTHKNDFIILYETVKDFIIEYKGEYYGSGFGSRDTGYTICKLDKQTLQPTYLLTNNRNVYNQTYYMEHLDDIGYILRFNYANYVIYKINTSTNSITQIGETLTGTNYIGSNPVKINGYYYMLFDNYDSTTTKHKYGFRKLKLDTTNDTIAHEVIEIKNYDDFKMDSSTDLTLPYGHEIWNQLQTFESNGHVYIECTIYCSPNYKQNYYQHKHVLLELKNDGIYIKQIIPLTDGCKGILFVNEDYKKPVFVLDNACLFYSFDETSQKFIQTYRKGTVSKTVGFDTLNRFLIHHTSGTIEMLTDTNACILQADFAEELYDKDDNTKIDTTVSFYAKNFLDEYIETNVKLTLTGPVVFKENNEKTLIISTLKTGLRTVPVTITGYGNIEVIITQNT